MKECCCASCGKEQEVKLGIPGKASATCPGCGHPLIAKNDEYAITVKTYHSPRKVKSVVPP